VFSINIVLYTLTWVRIYKQDRKLRRFKGTKVFRASTRVARSISLFVFAFFIQWWPNFVFGLWSVLVDDPRDIFDNVKVIFANLGGVFNLVVYVIIRRRRVRSKDRNCVDRPRPRRATDSTPTIANISTGQICTLKLATNIRVSVDSSEDRYQTVSTCSTVKMSQCVEQHSN